MVGTSSIRHQIPKLIVRLRLNQQWPCCLHNKQVNESEQMDQKQTHVLMKILHMTKLAFKSGKNGQIEKCR